MPHLRIPLLLLLGLTAFACGSNDEEAASEPAAAAPQVDTPTEPEPEAEPEAQAAAEAAPATANAEPPADGETVTLQALRDGFAADADAWTGRTVTVEAQFLSATNVGGSLNNISLIVNEEDYAQDRLRNSMMCGFGDNAPDSVDLQQYDEVTVRGTVVERFRRAGLDNCEIVTAE